MILLLATCESKRLRAKRYGFLFLFASVLLAAAGCGGRTGDVTGTVNFQGKPLKSGLVSFFDKAGQVVGTSEIAQGKYTIRKVPPGPVTITVTTLPVFTQQSGAAASSSKDQPAPREETTEIPPNYGVPDRSGLTYEVKPGSQEHPIDLK